MAITWVTPAGRLGIITERVIQDITISATTNTTNPVTYSVIAGSLPRGLRLKGNKIIGSPTEVRRFTEYKFVIRASDTVDLEDRTFSLGVDGADIPEWITKEGFLNVGAGDAYFVLDNSYVNFQLDATDTDLTAGDTLEYYLTPMGGELPPGLSLSKDGVISGFTDPIFAVEYSTTYTGAYDTGSFDTTPLDIVEAKSNGFDSYFYDSQTFDYSEGSRGPRRLSRIYTFSVSITDGANTVNRIFKIYVVTEEFLQADNSILQVDTNLFQADASANRIPLWITESDLGKYRANNYLTVYLDVYDPPSLSGTITYIKLPTNPDNTASELPPGLVLDSVTGEIAGRVPYQAKISQTYTFTMLAVNFPAQLANVEYSWSGTWNSTSNYFVDDAVTFLNEIYICTTANRNKIPNLETEFWTKGTTSAAKTFSIEIIGEIESAINWITPSNRGNIKPNQSSTLFVQAESLLYGGKVVYELVSGTLPPGLSFLPTGLIEGKVKQFADSTGLGLTRFFDRDSSLVDSSGSVTYNTSFDGATTSYDKVFKFSIKARDSANFAESIKEFTITVIADNTKTFANLYVKSFQSKEKRLSWYNFITDANIFVPGDIYRYGDNNFGIQTDLKMIVFAGIESVDAVRYVQAMSRNHYRKRLLFGNVKSAKAKDPTTQETIYEVVYVEVVDPYEKNGQSISQTIELPDNTNSKVLVSYDAIRIDSNIPLVSDRDHQRVFPNSIKNMRKQIRAIGDRDREFLPLWMRSIQDFATSETGYVKALPLCYVNPGKADALIARIKASDFDFKTIDFQADRYLIDVLDGEIEDKYLAFPQRGEKLP